MRIYNIKKVKDCKDYIGKQPLKSHFTELIKEPTKFVLDGKVVAIYDKVENEISDFAKKISLTTNPNKSRRSGSGVRTSSSVFGSIPKNGIRNPSCKGAIRNKLEKQNFALITKVAESISKKYEYYLPRQYEDDKKTVLSMVEKDYLLRICHLRLTTQIKIKR